MPCTIRFAEYSIKSLNIYRQSHMQIETIVNITHVIKMCNEMIFAYMADKI